MLYRVYPSRCERVREPGMFHALLDLGFGVFTQQVVKLDGMRPVPCADMHAAMRAFVVLLGGKAHYLAPTKIGTLIHAIVWLPIKGNKGTGAWWEEADGETRLNLNGFMRHLADYHFDWEIVKSVVRGSNHAAA